jgi:hypothetical protein
MEPVFVVHLGFALPTSSSTHVEQLSQTCKQTCLVESITCIGASLAVHTCSMSPIRVRLRVVEVLDGVRIDNYFCSNMVCAPSINPLIRVRLLQGIACPRNVLDGGTFQNGA